MQFYETEKKQDIEGQKDRDKGKYTLMLLQQEVKFCISSFEYYNNTNNDFQRYMKSYSP